MALPTVVDLVTLVTLGDVTENLTLFHVRRPEPSDKERSIDNDDPLQMLMKVGITITTFGVRGDKGRVMKRVV